MQRRYRGGYNLITNVLKKSLLTSTHFVGNWGFLRISDLILLRYVLCILNLEFLLLGSSDPLIFRSRGRRGVIICSCFAGGQAGGLRWVRPLAAIIITVVFLKSNFEIFTRCQLDASRAISIFFCTAEIDFFAATTRTLFCRQFGKHVLQRSLDEIIFKLFACMLALIWYTGCPEMMIKNIRFYSKNECFKFWCHFKCLKMFTLR